jgi:hypothetical protein
MGRRPQTNEFKISIFFFFMNIEFGYLRSQYSFSIRASSKEAKKTMVVAVFLSAIATVIQTEIRALDTIFNTRSFESVTLSILIILIALKLIDKLGR